MGDLLSSPYGGRLCVFAARDFPEFASAGRSWSELEVGDLLDQVISEARYWEPPHPDLPHLSNPSEGDLAAVADALERAASAQWWREPMPVTNQWQVRWPHSSWHRMTYGDPAVAITRWLEGTRAEELEFESRAESGSDSWWSAPRVPSSGWFVDSVADLICSTRSLPDAPAAGLLFVEDGGDYERAMVTRVRVADSARVLEITGPEDWQALVEGYPLEVTWSRHNDWLSTFGVESRWFIPNYAEVARDYDGMHLPVWGYLTAAGTPLPVTGGATVLAGWSPDETYWLTEAARLEEEPFQAVPTHPELRTWARG